MHRKREERVVPASHPLVQKKINKSLDYSIRDGAYSAVSTNTGSSYFSPFAIFMKASNFQVGILSAFTFFIPSIAQLFSTRLIEKFRRKSIVLFFATLALLTFIPIFLTGYLYYIGFPYAVWVLIGFVALFHVFYGIPGPVWFSWMGSLVPKEARGRYFSRRNFIYNVIGIISLVSAALVLDNFKARGIISGRVEFYTLMGFGILFLIALVTRVIALFYLSLQYEPRLKVRKKDYFSFWQFIRKARKNDFGRFTIYRFWYSVAISISTPFWAVYMLRDLGFSYFWYIAIVSSAIVFQLMFLPIWGKLTDKFGNIEVMKFCAFAGSIAPLIWLATPLIDNGILLRVYLFILPGITGGIAWSGYTLATNNYIYDAVKPEKQSFGNTYMNLMVGLGAFLGSAIGSIIVLFEIPFMNTILFIFLVSFIFRFFMAIYGLGYLREVRRVKRFYPKYFFREIHPVGGLRNEFHNLENIMKKVEHYI